MGPGRRPKRVVFPEGVRLLQHGCDVHDIVNMAANAAVDAQRAEGQAAPAPYVAVESPGVAEPEPAPVA